MLKEYCGALQQRLEPQLDYYKARNVLYICESEADVQRDGRVQLAMHHLLGVHPTGPYHLNETGNFLQRITAAANGYSSSFGRPPDMVIVSSNMWDQSRVWSHQEGHHGTLNKLLPEIVQSWSVNFSMILSAVEVEFPVSAGPIPKEAFDVKLDMTKKLKSGGVACLVLNWNASPIW
jgi:hypothetical protein